MKPGNASLVLKRWLPRIIVLGILAGGVAFLWLKKPWAKGPTPIGYNTVSVSKGPIAAQVTANGTLSARGTTLVGAQISGRVLELHADFNDRVKKGQLLAKLDESVLKAQIDQATAAYNLALANAKKAEVTLADARRQYARQKTLQDQQLVAGATVEAAEVTRDSAMASLSAARAQVQQAQANLSQAKTNMTYAAIYSPVDGVVLSRSIELGQTVAASLQAPTLFTIAEDLERMQINTAVAEADVGRLSEGMKASFTVDAFPGKQFEGVVRQVRNAPTTNAGVVTYDAVIDVENKEKTLRPGMTANVTFVLEQVADAVRIPNAALRFKITREQLAAIFPERMRGGSGGGGGGGPPRNREGAGPGGGGGGPPGGMRRGPDGRPELPPDRKIVWKLVAGKPERVIVKIGLTDGSLTQMVEGELAPGDQLVTEITGLPSQANQRRVGAF